MQAVTHARSLLNGTGGGTPSPVGTLGGEVHPNLVIPDDHPEGIVSHIDIIGTGRLKNIVVTVDISHTWQGDLRVILIAPGGFTALLHDMSGGSTDDLKRTYQPSNRPDLANLVLGAIAVNGRWILHVSDRARRDVGQFNSWRLELETV